MKKCWITHWGNDKFALSFESNSAEEHQRLVIKEITFPENKPLKERKHVISISLLTEDELIKIRDVINAVLK
jgi:hypothetical protein